MADLSRIREIFDSACDLPAGEREFFVSSQCGDDVEAFAEVMDLIATLDETTGFLETPVSHVSDKPSTLKRNTRLKNRYVVDEEIGAGGFGTVYLAADQQLLGRKVVVKVLEQSADDSSLRHRFEREIQTLAKIDHPGVVGILDYGSTVAGRPFLVMQYVSGTNLRKLLAEQSDPWTPAHASRFLLQLASALTAAHAEGVCHRDLKPENIIVRNPGQADEAAVIIDFGIATLVEGNTSSATTRVAGSPAYMAPEQLLGRPTAASDQYSLGLIAFELLTNRRLHDFEIEIAPQEVARHNLARLSEKLAPAARDAVCRAVHFDSKARFGSVAEFAGAFAKAVAPSRRLFARAAAIAGVIAVALPAGYWLRIRLSTQVVPREVLWRMEIRQSEKLGSASKVMETARLDRNDRFRIRVRSNYSGRLYMLNESNGLTILSAPRWAEPGVWLSVPPKPEDWLWLEPGAAEEILWIVWSETPNPDFERAGEYANTRLGGEIADSNLAQTLRRLLTAHRKDGNRVLHDQALAAIRVPISFSRDAQSK